MSRLKLRRPIAFFDLETTGTDPREDRIVEISVLKVSPDGSREIKTRRIDPGVPIPAASTEIHGIRDEDVADEPTFAQVAKSLFAFLDDCDLAGYGIFRFDVPLLVAEFERVGMAFDIRDRAIVDALTIFHQRERRDLDAALQFYCGETLEEAHSAEADILATFKVLEGQLDRYDDLPTTPEELDGIVNPERGNWVDAQGKLVWKDGEVAFNFGKHRGELVREVAKARPDYLNWLLEKDFREDVKEVFAGAVRGEVPSRS